MITQQRPRPGILTRRDGGVFIVAVVLIAVLAVIAGHTCLTVTERYRFQMQANSWQESLMAAESGADMAMSAFQNGKWPDGTAFTKPAVSSTSSYSASFTHSSGEGSNKLAASVKVDAPSGLSDGSGQWYRVRSTGISEAPKTKNIGYEAAVLDVNGTKQAHANMLRKFNYTTDKSGGLLSLPQVARTVEIIVKPNSPPLFTAAGKLAQYLTMSGGGVIDAFDSSDPLYSGTGGTPSLYNPAKRQSNSEVDMIATGGNSDLKSTYVYGDIKYNGPAPANATNVQGTMTPSYSGTVTTPSAPSWSSGVTPTPTIINNTTTLNAGTAASPTRYIVSSLTVGGGKSLTLHNPSAGEAYIEIWVQGDFTTSGSGYIAQEAGVHVTYYVDGNVTVSGSSFQNSSNLAANCIMYCTGSATGTPKVTISGGGNFIGAIDAPSYAFTISGLANLSGAFIGKTMNISGGASVHFDNALKKLGGSGSGAYQVASWVEDIR